MNVSPQSSLLKLFSNEVTRAFLTFIHLFIYSFFFFHFSPIVYVGECHTTTWET